MKSSFNFCRTEIGLCWYLCQTVKNHENLNHLGSKTDQKYRKKKSKTFLKNKYESKMQEVIFIESAHWADSI